MIKVFSTNKDGKIELTKDELKVLLDEAYWEGFVANNKTYVYNTPSLTPWTPPYNPYYITCNGTDITIGNSTSVKDIVDNVDCTFGM